MAPNVPKLYEYSCSVSELQYHCGILSHGNISRSIQAALLTSTSMGSYGSLVSLDGCIDVYCSPGVVQEHFERDILLDFAGVLADSQPRRHQL